MTEEEKLVRQAQGYDFITEYKGKTICLNTKDFNKERFCKDFGFKEVDVFTEKSGNKVLYDPTQYEIYSGSVAHRLQYADTEVSPNQPIGLTNCHLLFKGSDATFFDFSEWDVSNVVDFTGMFWDCRKLKSINLSGWDFSNGLKFSRMFSNCESLQSLDVKDWDVSKGRIFNNMFTACESLQSLDISHWDISKGETFAGFFRGCKNLRTLDISCWDVSKCSDFREMFAGCEYLLELEVDLWELSRRVKYIPNPIGLFENMFDECYELFEKYKVWNSDDLVKKLFAIESNEMSFF